MTWNRAEILHLRHPIRSHDSSQFLKMLNNRESQIEEFSGNSVCSEIHSFLQDGLRPFEGGGGGGGGGGTMERHIQNPDIAISIPSDSQRKRPKMWPNFFLKCPSQNTPGWRNFRGVSPKSHFHKTKRDHSNYSLKGQSGGSMSTKDNFEGKNNLYAVPRTNQITLLVKAFFG